MAKLKNSFNLLLAITFVTCFFALANRVSADSFGAFATTKYYSVNKHYFLKVTPTKRATLYRVKKGKIKALWTQTLEELPGQLLVSNDGSRVVIIDQYYGNKNKRSAPAVIILGEMGEQITYKTIDELADISKVRKTISNSEWYDKANLITDNNYLDLETITTKGKVEECYEQTLSTKEMDECLTPTPNEQIRFNLKTGEIVSRIKLNSK